jgi:hypothetical protein
VLPQLLQPHQNVGPMQEADLESVLQQAVAKTAEKQRGLIEMVELLVSLQYPSRVTLLEVPQLLAVPQLVVPAQQLELWPLLPPQRQRQRAPARLQQLLAVHP